MQPNPHHAFYNPGKASSFRFQPPTGLLDFDGTAKTKTCWAGFPTIHPSLYSFPFPHYPEDNAKNPLSFSAQWPISSKLNAEDASCSMKGSPRNIVFRALEVSSDKAKSQLPKIANLERHEQNLIFPPNFETRTARQEDFVKADSGMDDTESIIIFTCRIDLCRLIQCATWVVAGTFKSCPEL
uniref:Uncharacterized protein n=1 Tax=Globodera rostochiensis TaxID=31243 RepID=A0A914HNQ3_GLORO